MKQLPKWTYVIRPVRYIVNDRFPGATDAEVCAAPDAHAWGVYRRFGDGQERWVTDLTTEDDALAEAERLARADVTD